jgi:hypothetical protein
LPSKTKDELIKDINEFKVNGSFELGIAIKNKKMFKDFYTKACKNLEAINHDIIISQFMIHTKIINTKIQLNENKNIIKINDTKNDEFSDCVYENIKRKFALKNSEKVYDKMYEKYI